MLRSAMLSGVVLCHALVCHGEMDGRPRVYIEQSRSWSLSGWSPFVGVLGGLGRGGARPQTAEILHTFQKRCQGVTPTLEREVADYIVLLEHEGGKHIFRKDNKYAVFEASGDLLKSGSTRMLGTAVSQACEAITGKP